VTAAKLLAFAELVLDSKSYATLGADGSEALSTIVELIVRRRWIEDLTVAIEKLIAASVSPVFNNWSLRIAAKEETPPPPAYHSITDRPVRSRSFNNYRRPGLASTQSPTSYARFTPIPTHTLFNAPLAEITPLHNPASCCSCRSHPSQPREIIDRTGKNVLPSEHHYVWNHRWDVGEVWRSGG
jgi:hypothetical protein